MQWLNEPASWQRTEEVLTVSVDPGTDFWRETGYGYIRDNGHVYGEVLPGDLDMSVRVRGLFASQYDQAGIMFRADDEVWLKTGLEYFDGRARLSTVLTLGRSSWMVTDLPLGTDEVTLRASRRGDAVEVRYVIGDGPAELAALVYLPPGRAVLAGVMCAAPGGAGFRVSFHGLSILDRQYAGAESDVWQADATGMAAEPLAGDGGWTEGELSQDEVPGHGLPGEGLPGEGLPAGALPAGDVPGPQPGGELPDAESVEPPAHGEVTGDFVWFAGAAEDTGTMPAWPAAAADDEFGEETGSWPEVERTMPAASPPEEADGAEAAVPGEVRPVVAHALVRDDDLRGPARDYGDADTDYGQADADYGQADAEVTPAVVAAPDSTGGGSDGEQPAAAAAAAAPFVSPASPGAATELADAEPSTAELRDKPAVAEPAGVAPASVESASGEAADDESADHELAGPESAGPESAGAELVGDRSALAGPDVPQRGAPESYQRQPALAEATTPDPMGSEPTGLEPTESEPTGLEPTESEPTGLGPTESEPTGLEPTEPDPAALDPEELVSTELASAELTAGVPEPTPPRPVAAAPPALDEWRTDEPRTDEPGTDEDRTRDEDSSGGAEGVSVPPRWVAADAPDLSDRWPGPPLLTAADGAPETVDVLSAAAPRRGARRAKENREPSPATGAAPLPPPEEPPDPADEWITLLTTDPDE